ncbi:hypothetical protein AB6A68_15095, partial [Ferrimicrobium acidiphilum]
MNFTVHTIHRKELILDPSDIHCKQSVSHPLRGWHISARTGGTFGRNTHLVIDADNDEYAELGVVPPDLLIDAVNIDVREGELVKVLFLPL